MIESPLLQKMRAETIHKGSLALLKARCGTIPRDVTKHLQGTLYEDKGTKLNGLAGQRADWKAFREALLS